MKGCIESLQQKLINKYLLRNKYIEGVTRVNTLVASFVVEYIPICVLLYLFLNIPMALNDPLTRSHK